MYYIEHHGICTYISTLFGIIIAIILFGFGLRLAYGSCEQEQKNDEQIIKENTPLIETQTTIYEKE